MIIKGNTVGTPMPRTDWNQENPKKANYLRGKEELTAFIEGKFNEAKTAASEGIAEAKEAASMGIAEAKAAASEGIAEAKAAAENAHTAANDAMTAAGNALTEAKNYTDSKHMTATVTLLASAWSEAAPYSQSINVEGILATDQPHYGVVYTDNWEAEKEAFASVDELVTLDGSVTFTCFAEKPEVNLTIQMEVNR